MSHPVYVLDACAMLAVLSKEQGADKVADIYKMAVLGTIKFVMNKFNLLEVYYDLYRAYGKAIADKFVEDIKQIPIAINHDFTDEIFTEAGRFKATYKISLADSIALAQTVISDGALVTADHHEFDVIEEKENIRFNWIR